MRPLRLLPLRQRHHGRPRHRIRRKLGEKVEQNTRVIRLIKASRGHPTRQFPRPRALDLKVDTLRIRLRAIRLPTGMQRDDLMSNHIVARREIRDRQRPAETVLDQVVGDPLAWVGPGFPCAGGDFGPEEGRGRDGAAVAVAGRYVVLDGTRVGDGPCVPCCYETESAKGI